MPGGGTSTRAISHCAFEGKYRHLTLRQKKKKKDSVPSGAQPVIEKIFKRAEKPSGGDIMASHTAHNVVFSGKGQGGR